jgi:hypothetical protein
MNRYSAILLFLAAGALIIAIHQSVVLGFGRAYWIFMLAIALFLGVRLLNTSAHKQDQSKPGKAGPDKNRKA